MHILDRQTARALAEAGYLPLSDYIAMFGEEGHRQATLVPHGCDDPHDAVEPAPIPARPVPVR